MNILFDLGHPSHVHLFKNFLFYLKQTAHNLCIVTRNKDVTNQLLNYYELPYMCLTNAQNTGLSMLGELIVRDFKLLKLHHKIAFDMAFGTSVSIGLLSCLSNVASFSFCEDDDDIIPVQAMIAYPFSTRIINPENLRYKRYAKKRVFHNSYHELAYLHPNNFQPDISILAKYDLIPGEYVIIRNSALRAHHDIGIRGIGTDLRHKMFEMIKGHSIVYTAEAEPSPRIDPWDMHDIMAFAKLLITDSQSMSMEASVLGLPNIRYNSFVGKITVLEELEHRYGLSTGFKPGDEQALLAALRHFLNNQNLHKEWLIKRDRMLSEKADFNQWMIAFFENECSKRRGRS